MHLLLPPPPPQSTNALEIVISSREGLLRGQDPEARTPRPGPRGQDPEARTPRPGPRGQDPEARTPRPGPRGQDPEARTPRPGPRGQDPEARTPRPGPRGQDPEARTPRPGPRGQDPEARSPRPGPRGQDPEAILQQPPNIYRLWNHGHKVWHKHMAGINKWTRAVYAGEWMSEWNKHRNLPWAPAVTSIWPPIPIILCGLLPLWQTGCDWPTPPEKQKLGEKSKVWM